VASGGKPQPTKRFGTYWSQKVQLWWQQFFVDFPKNKCNLLHKNKLDIMTSMTSINNYPEFTVKQKKL